MDSALRVLIDGDRAKRELKTLETGLGGMERAGLRATKGMDGLSARSDRMASSMRAGTGAVGAMTNAVRALLGPMLALYGISGTLQIIKDAQAANALLNRAAEATVGFANAQAYVIETSQRMSVDINAARESFARLLVIQEQGKITAEQSVLIYEGMIDAQKALGASGQDLERVMYGLSQSFDVLNAENLNQVVEPLPGLLSQIGKAAKEMGVAVEGTGAEFKRLVAEGKITSEMFGQILPKALQAYKGAAEDMAGGIQAMTTRATNAWRLLVEMLEQPVSDVITPILDGITAGLTMLRDAIQSDSIRGAWSVVIDSWMSEIDRWVPAVDAMIGVVTGLIAGGAAQAGFDWQTATDLVIAAIQIWPQAMTAVMTLIIGGVDQAINVISNIWANLTAVVQQVMQMIPAYAERAAVMVKSFFLSAIDGIISAFSSMMTAIAKNMASVSQSIEGSDFIPDGIEAGMASLTRSFTSGAVALQGYANNAQAANDRLLDIDGHIGEMKNTLRETIQANNDAAASYQAASTAAVEAAFADVAAARSAIDAKLEALAAQKQITTETQATARETILAASQQAEANKTAAESAKETAKATEAAGKAAAGAASGTKKLSAEQAKAALETKKHQAELEKLLKTQADGYRALDEYIQGLEEEVKLLQESAEVRESVAAVMEAEAIAQKHLIELTEDQKSTIEGLVNQKKELEAAAEREKQHNEELQRSYEQLADSVQSGFSDLFMNIFEGGKDAMGDLFDTIKKWFFKLIADMLAHAIANPIMLSLGLGGGGGGGLGGIVGSLFGGGGGGGILSSIGSLFGMGGSGTAGAGGGGLLGGLFGGSNPLSSIFSLGSSLFGGIGSMIGGIGSALSGVPVLGSLVSGLGSAVSGITGAIGGLTSSITGALGVGGAAAGGGAALGGAAGGALAGVGGMAMAAIPVIGAIFAIGSMFDLWGGSELAERGLDLGYVADGSPTPGVRGGGIFQGGSFSNFEGTGLFGRDSSQWEWLPQELMDGLTETLNGARDGIIEIGHQWGIDSAEALLQGWGTSERIQVGKDATDEEFQQALQDWMARTIGAMAEQVFSNSAFSGVFDGLESRDEITETLSALSSLSGYINADPIEDFNAALENSTQTAAEAAESIHVGLIEAIRGFDGSRESLLQLSQQAQEVYQMELQMIGQIRSAMEGVAQITQSSVDAILQTTMTDAERYAHLTAQAESLGAALLEMTDAEQIAATIQEINSLSVEAWNLLQNNASELGVSSRMLPEMQAQFVAFLQSMGEIAAERLELAEQEIVAQHTVTANELSQIGQNTDMDGVAESFAAAVAGQMEAAGAEFEAHIGAAIERFHGVADEYKSAAEQQTAAAVAMGDAANRIGQAVAGMPQSVNVRVERQGGEL